MKSSSVLCKGPTALFAFFALIAVASSAAFAAVEPPAVSTSGALLQGLLGLVMVLAALAAFFWFLRKFSPGQTAAQGSVKVVGGVMLGPRERLVVVEVGETWLLLGVGGGQVSTLHTLPRPEGYTPITQESLPGLLPAHLPKFADKLKELLSKRQA
jgi:flagellar protein FliO/FliZ